MVCPIKSTFEIFFGERFYRKAFYVEPIVHRRQVLDAPHSSFILTELSVSLKDQLPFVIIVVNGVELPIFFQL